MGKIKLEEVEDITPFKCFGPYGDSKNGVYEARLIRYKSGRTDVTCTGLLQTLASRCDNFRHGNGQRKCPFVTKDSTSSEPARA